MKSLFEGNRASYSFFSKDVILYGNKHLIPEVSSCIESILHSSLNEMIFFLQFNIYILYAIMPGSWQMLHGENMRPWRKRCSPSYLCHWQAVCPAAVFPRRLATPVEISPLQSPHPSPPPLPSAAVHLQVAPQNTPTSSYRTDDSLCWWIKKNKANLLTGTTYCHSCIHFDMTGYVLYFQMSRLNILSVSNQLKSYATTAHIQVIEIQDQMS